MELINSTGNVVDACGNGHDRSWLAPAKQEHDSPEVFGICGGACAISARAWRQLGGMRQDLFMYYEDTDFSYRLRRAGYRVQYVPSPSPPRPRGFIRFGLSGFYHLEHPQPSARSHPLCASLGGGSGPG